MLPDKIWRFVLGDAVTRQSGCCWKLFRSVRYAAQCAVVNGYQCDQSKHLGRS